MKHSITVYLAALALVALPPSLGAQTSQGGFETMVQPTNEQVDCKAPRPPRDLAETAYIRNGYRAILRIMAIEHWQKTGECDCQFDAFTWQDVVERSDDFVTSDNSRLPFDVVELDNRANDLEEARSAACSAE